MLCKNGDNPENPLTFQTLTRRRFALGAAAALAGLHAPASRAQAPARPYLADMHSH